MICLVSYSLEEISASIIEEQAVRSLCVRKILNTNVINVGHHLLTKVFRQSWFVISFSKQRGK